MEWQLNEAGNVRTEPVAGWNMAVIPLNVLVGVHLLDADGRLTAVQFHMSGAQCREFALALLRKADQLDAQSAALPRQ